MYAHIWYIDAYNSHYFVSNRLVLSCKACHLTSYQVSHVIDLSPPPPHYYLSPQLHTPERQNPIIILRTYFHTGKITNCTVFCFPNFSMSQFHTQSATTKKLAITYAVTKSSPRICSLESHKIIPKMQESSNFTILSKF